MSPRSLNVAQQHMQKVKDALKRSGFRSQLAFATEMGAARDTVRKFVNGKNIDRNNFIDFCEKLGLDWQRIVDKPLETNTDPNFVGRENAIATLDHLINKKKGKIINIYGMGGVGKTALAKQYLKAKGFDLVLEVIMATRTEDITPVTFIVEEWLKNDFTVEPSQDFGISLKRLKEQLKTRKVGLLIDNLEMALEGGKFIEDHHQYVDLFKVLADADVQSLTLITSRERLTESGVEVEYYPLEGLDKDAWNEYFIYHQLIIDSSTVTAMCNAYGGNAKAMTLICSQVNLDYSKGIKQYWQDHKIDLLANPTLKHLVNSQFDRLEKHDTDAYNLLLRLGCFRYLDISRVPFDGVKCLLFDVVETNEQLRVIERLKNRALVEHKNGEYWLHSVIKQEALTRLKRSPDDYKKAQEAAAEYWKNSVETVATIDDALKALEAYYHYLLINDFENAGSVLIQERDDIWLNRELYPIIQKSSLLGCLTRLGLFSLVISLIQKMTDINQFDEGYLLAKLNNSLGECLWKIGSPRKAIECFNKCYDLSSKYNLTFLAVDSLYNKARCYLYLLEFEKSLNFFETVINQSKDIDIIKNRYVCGLVFKYYLMFCIYKKLDDNNAIEQLDKLLDSIQLGIKSNGYIYLYLARIHQNFNEIEKAINKYNKALQYSEKINFKQLQAKALTGIGEVHRIQKEYKTAINHHNQSIEILEEIGAKCDLAEAYYQLALTYQEMKEMAKSQEYCDKAIELFEEIDAPKQVERVQTKMRT